MLVKDLSDGFVESPEQKYPMGMLVHARVKEVNVNKDSSDHPQYQLSLRSSDVDGDRKAAILATLSVGQVVSGTVQKVTEYGVFVALDHLEVVGLCKTIDAVNRNQQLHEVYSQGDTVRAMVLKISGSKLSLGLKETYFQDQETDSELENNSDMHDTEKDEEDEDVVLEEVVSDSDEGSIEEMIRNARVPMDVEDEDHDEAYPLIHDNNNDDDGYPNLSKGMHTINLPHKRKAEGEQWDNKAKDIKASRLVSSNVEVLEWDDFQPADVKVNHLQQVLVFIIIYVNRC